jgi:N-acetylneuraminate lyase
MTGKLDAYPAVLDYNNPPMNHQPFQLRGLTAATYTPFHRDGSLNLDVIPAMVDFLKARGIDGLYVCGSTGEGVSMSTPERQTVARTFVEAANGELPIVVQVGHNSLEEARQLAAHAQHIGADAISATVPSFFKVTCVEVLVDCVAQIAAAAPDLPFYYYHIPVLTGSTIDMPEFLEIGGQRIPNLVGLKYTAPTVYEYQACLELQDGRFDVLWGCDEMLLSALVVGAKGAVGSTYNVAGPLYRQLIDAFNSGNIPEARRCQSLAMTLVRRLCRYPFHPAMKEIMKMHEIQCGPCRLPMTPLSADQAASLRKDLEGLRYFDWSKPSERHSPQTQPGSP